LLGVRLGGGMIVHKSTDTELRPVLEHVIAEIASAAPDRHITSQIEVTEPVYCDTARLGQMLSNLVSNALTHGQKDAEVQVVATTADGRFELSVANQGDPIPAAVAAHLFEPFKRAADDDMHEGLGLGLYICAEIARAHGGQIDLSSTAAETRFTFTMPNRR
jgi:phosphoserine phosphatase RsbU/P